MTTTKGPGLYEFLIEAELQQYYSGLKNDLKVQSVSHLKYVAEQDLQQLGMTKPEIRRLRKYFLKHYPQNYFAKFKKMILSKEERDTWDLMIPEENSSDNKPPVRVPNKHIIPADSILVNKELGTGEFGVVQQGVWTNDGERIQVAIKCLSRERMQNNPIEFLKEAAIMHSIDHEHIVRLYGVVLDTNALMLVTELAPLRSLLECLKEPSLRTSFPVLTLCDFAIQICDGMQYLELKRLIHRDLAARNILVFSKNKVKISDFGLSRALGVGKDYYQTNFNVNLKLPIAWCAPECISYLRFTSASDVWAYGVTLWEMFSYGFQPWAALTGHQILEAIDEPNFQRLEQPECCPKEYYTLMLKCWQHDPNKRPRFSDLMSVLPDCKPEQVQAIQDSIDERTKRDHLAYHVGDVITVLHKMPVGSNGIPCWKGVLNNGKSGLFNPTHTVSYLGANLPSTKVGEFPRGSLQDGKLYASRRSRIRPEMISCPQGDVKHTGHVGLDGAYFGDISFLGSSGTKYNHLPHQIVTPYKPQEDSTNSTEPSTPAKMCSDRAPLISPDKGKSHNSGVWMDYESIKAPSTNLNCVTSRSNKQLTDHEYHEINNEEPTSESPRFEKSFDFGPSLLDEMDAMFKTLGTEVNNSMVAGISNYASSPPPSPLDVDINKRNELREIAASVAAAASTMHKGKKKQASVKPISAADEKTLDEAIAMANELAARSMNNADGTLNSSLAKPDSPVTPVSPNKRKFSFRFPTTNATNSSSRPEGKTFSDEAASIPDIQSLCNSLKSLPSYDSVDSLKETSPFRIPIWDRTSTEYCFAKSHALIMRHHPTLYSVEELSERLFSDTTAVDNILKCSKSLDKTEFDQLQYADDDDDDGPSETLLGNLRRFSSDHDNSISSAHLIREQTLPLYHCDVPPPSSSTLTAVRGSLNGTNSDATKRVVNACNGFERDAISEYIDENVRTLSRLSSCDMDGLHGRANGYSVSAGSVINTSVTTNVVQSRTMINSSLNGKTVTSLSMKKNYAKSRYGSKTKSKRHTHLFASSSFPNSPRYSKYNHSRTSSRSTPLRQSSAYEFSSSDSEYETARCQSVIFYNSASSSGTSMSKYRSYSKCNGATTTSSSSDNDFSEMMKPKPPINYHHPY